LLLYFSLLCFCLFNSSSQYQFSSVPTVAANVPVACAVADIKILPLAYEPKAEEIKEERKATPPPLRNCHML
jgi:hypothetical protein